MTELRRDPLSGHWVIIASNRAARPNEFARFPAQRTARRCPFCAGHEADTPPAVCEYSAPEDRPGTAAGWQVRVVPNKYPALFPGGESASSARPGPVSRAAGQPGNGVHEVIIESPQHVASFSQLTPLQARLTFQAYRDRMRDLKTLQGLSCGLAFKNEGAAAGASIEHCHSQILVTPMVPPAIAHELAASLQYARRAQNCFFCELLDDELRDGARIVTESNRFVAFCPFASRFPFETWIVPRLHASHYETLDEESLGHVSALVQSIIRKYETVLGEVAYNYLIHSAPFDTLQHDHYHWHIEILPRIANVAGFEWGTGCFINTTPPERAAVHLRSGRKFAD